MLKDKQNLHARDVHYTAAGRGGKLRWMFVGRCGIRAGWGALLFVAIFAIADVGLGFVAGHFLPRPDNAHVQPLANGLVMNCINLFAVAVATASLAKIEGRSLFAYGLQGSDRGPRLLSGAVFGFVAISILVLSLWQFGLLRLDVSTTERGFQAWRYAVIWAIAFIMAGISEESLLRGYLQYTLSRGMGFWPSSVFLSLVFGAMHWTNPGETLVGVLAATLMGLILCMTLWFTGSLWWAIGFHAAWDWGESAVYGNSDSGRLIEHAVFTSEPLGNMLLTGGGAGPEGSLLIFPLMGIIALLIWVRSGLNPSSSFTQTSRE
ncbi:CPBP family intramembrane glutamic endopeptidase [Paraburkholderia tropica]|uniref:CPBP family intramembrane glutamic endopeptidase n=1 Tax=Paraburkholderia TaxID=1822464 RepID=UPI0032B371AD